MQERLRSISHRGRRVQRGNKRQQEATRRAEGKNIFYALAQVGSHAVCITPPQQVLDAPLAVSQLGVSPNVDRPQVQPRDRPRRLVIAMELINCQVPWMDSSNFKEVYLTIAT